MSGGGTYYTRDTEDGYAKTNTGSSLSAQKQFAARTIDPGSLPCRRRIVSKSSSLLACLWDGTGSMGVFPEIICDKAPALFGEMNKHQILLNAELMLGIIGDIRSDEAGVQIGDPTELAKADDWLNRLKPERKGGCDGGYESYEFMAYFMARCVEMPNAKTPFCIFTGDEDYRDTLYESDLVRIFGGQHETVEAKKIFEELRRNFRGNVLLIHRPYENRIQDEKNVRRWQELLGEDHVVILHEDRSIADVTLGIPWIVTGKITLDGYAEYLKTGRKKPQTPTRIANVRRSLECLTVMADLPSVYDAQKNAPGTSKEGPEGNKKDSEGDDKGTTWL